MHSNLTLVPNPAGPSASWRHGQHLGGVRQHPQPQSVCSLDQIEMRGRSNIQQKIAADDRCLSCVQGGLSTF
jgi:hypothetical protein